ISDTTCLKGVVLKLPSAVRAGQSLQLVCEYDLEGAQLYSIKFYLGEQEFYRFVPKESPPTRVFPLPGVQVDIYLSNSTVVTLSNVQKELTGFYACEVSADAPLFHTVIKDAPVIVTEEPIALPEVSVEKGKYSLGEKIRANCTSQGGYPPANLTWFINGKEVKEWVGSVVTEIPGLSEVEFEARSSLFRDGKLRLRCLATQFTLYRRTAEVDLQEDTPQLAHVMGPTVSPSSEMVNSTAWRMGTSPWIVPAALATLTWIAPR
ncbi:uncharacterized protein LOC106673978, partial [Cimex lectularius]|uniref:Ig-like domain-containing protein n=1 Tax=Cimex lectularius TaxID=79782 RepID=A0A8I6TMP3_CIMLE